MSEDPLSQITDIREYDVPYLARVCIDLNMRIGCWYDVVSDRGVITVTRQTHILTPSNPKVFAFDIECSKAPLKFPNAEYDSIYMISVMIDGRGILIINREIVSKDINDFEYGTTSVNLVMNVDIPPNQIIRAHFMSTMRPQKKLFFAVSTHSSRRKSLTFSCHSTGISLIGHLFEIALLCMELICRQRRDLRR